MPSTHPALLELNLQTLSSKLPNQYRQWLRAGIGLVILGYALAFGIMAYEGRVSSVFAAREPYVILFALVAAWCEQRGWLRAAASILFSSVWVELHVTLFEEGIRSVGTSVFSATLVGIAICVGRRPAIWSALSALVTVPLALMLGWSLGASPARSSGDFTALGVLLVSMLAATCMLHLLLDAFRRVLLQSERNAERARELTDDAPDVMIALSDRGTVEDANPAAGQLLGLPRSELLGQRFDDLPLTPLSEEAPRDDGARISGRVPREYVATGSGHTLEGLFRAVTRADGSTGLLLWLRDITLRKRAEAQTIALREQLQHSQKLEALGRLAGGVAHDFNNLLTTVGGYADLVARHEDPKIRDIARELASIRERGKSMTGQLLAFARKEKSEPQSVDLADTLSGMDHLLRRLLDEHIELSLDLESGATVYIDPGQLQQVVLNLVVNAKDAMPSGGRLELSCRVDREQHRVVLRVEDTGTGMETDVKQRIFEPFFTTKPRGQGTGLGLSMVHGIVEASSGRLEVDSEPGRGTRFVLSWPSSSSVPQRSHPHLTPLPRARAGGCLLVAEDDPEGRTLLVSLLEASGYDVIAAENGRVALERFEALREAGGSVDLIVSDVRMPEMGGPELARRLRAIEPNVPIVFVSGYYEPDVDAVTGASERDILGKPYTTAELLSRIERALDREPLSRARPA